MLTSTKRGNLNIGSDLKHSVALAAGLGAVIVWGLTPAVTRHLVLHYDPLAIVSLRFAITLAVTTPILILVQPWPGYRSGLTAGSLGVLGFLGYNWPNHLGAGLIPSSYASLIIAIEPALIAFIAAASGATLNRNLWVGIGLSLIGAILPAISQLPFEIRGSSKGYLLVAFGALCWSLYSVFSKPLATRMGSVRFALASAIGGSCACSLLAPHAAWIAATELSASDWVLIFSAAIMSTTVAAIGWAVAITALGPGVAGPLLSLIPVIGLVCGVGVLGEDFSISAIGGGVLTTLGVIFSTRPRSSSST